MKKRKKLKKSVIYILITILILIGIFILGSIKYKEYKYHQTYEYKLINHGYKKSDVTKILNTFKKEDYKYFLNNEVNDDYIKLLDEKYFLKKNFYKYISYMKENTNVSISNVIKNINIHLDNKFYEVTYQSDTSKDTKILVNKYYILDESFTPDDLTTISPKYSWGDKGSQMIRKVAYDAFIDMWNAAYEEAGYYLMISSSFRSYSDQEIVYNNYKNSRGQKYADGIAARAGSSEHQTGLALDIFSKLNNNKNTFKDTETAKWLKENSYKYGFILRYPEELVNVTGYNYESWHFRYIGKKEAQYIYENNISFEEYYAFFIE